MGKGNFDISAFANKFIEQAEEKLKKDKINEIKEFLETKKELDVNTNSLKSLESFTSIVVTRAHYYQEKKGLAEALIEYITQWKTPFESPEAKEKFKNLVKEYSPERIKDENMKRINEFFNYSSVKEFTVKLYELSREGKRSVLGEKGRDNYLRDVGYFDRIPIDKHEMRFMIRTGIFHCCSEHKRKSDPLTKQDYHKALTNFCEKYVGDKQIEGIHLKNAPGIVDMFIWAYCVSRAKGGYNICSKTPKCEKCSLESVCLYPILNND